MDDTVSFIKYRAHIPRVHPNVHNGVLVDPNIAIVEYHLLPHERRASDIPQCLVGFGRKLLEGIDDRPSRTEFSLSRRVLGHALHIDLVTACPKVLRSSEGRGTGEDPCGEIRNFGIGKA